MRFPPALSALIILFVVMASPATGRTEQPAAAAQESDAMSPPADETTTDATVKMGLAQVLAVAKERGREARLAKEELAREVQSLHFVRAGYHTQGQAVVTNEDDDSLTITKKLSSGAKAQVQVSHDQYGNETQAFSIDHALFINNAFDIRIANLTYSVARESFRSRMEQFKFRVIQDFFTLVRAQERLKTLMEGVKRAQALVAFAQARYELGTANKIDVLNTQVDLANAQNQVIAQRQEVARVRDELLDLMGLPLDVELEAVDSLELEKPGEPVAGWYRSELVAERGRVEIARTRVNEARYRTYPDIHLNTGASDDTGQGRPDVTTTLKYNFPIGTAPVDYEYRRLKHDYESAQLTYQNRQFEIAKEKRDILRTLSTKENSVKIASQAMANARESYEASQISFQRGIISSIDLRTSQAALTSARENYISLLIDYRLATYQYRKAYGGDL